MPEPRLKTKMPATGVLCARDSQGVPIEETGRAADAALAPPSAPKRDNKRPATPVSKDEE